VIPSHEAWGLRVKMVESGGIGCAGSAFASMRGNGSDADQCRPG
jgi:hypothetical protein